MFAVVQVGRTCKRVIKMIFIREMTMIIQKVEEFIFSRGDLEWGMAEIEKKK